MNLRILGTLLAFSCAGPAAPLTPAEPPDDEAEAPSNDEESTESAPALEDHCNVRTARVALARSTSASDAMVRVTRFESEDQEYVAFLEAIAGEDLETLLLHVGECRDQAWHFWERIPIGSFPKVAGEGPDRYERSEVQLSSSEISSGSRAVQVEWRHAPQSSDRVERRSVRWYELLDAGPTLLAECTTRDLRSIDDSSFVQGHEMVRGWRILPGSPPRLVGTRVAGGGTLRGRVIVWSDVTDRRTLDVSLGGERHLSEICL